MKNCKECGAQVNDGDKFCPKCGADMNAQNTQDEKKSSSGADDVTENKVMGILAYISWLVLIPIFAAPKSKFARFHANQGLVLAIFELIWWIIQGIVGTALMFSWGMWGAYMIVTTLLGLVNILFLVLAILGIVNASKGECKELPLIGKIKILK